MCRTSRLLAVVLALAAAVSPCLQSARAVVQRPEAGDDAASCYSLAVGLATLCKGTRGSGADADWTLPATDGPACAVPGRIDPGLCGGAQGRHRFSSVAFFLLHRHLTI